jgi:hypothetical protein
VSCVSAAACTAVGYNTTTSKSIKTLVESWNGTSWSEVHSPAPGQLSWLSGVSCVPAATCTATGWGENVENHNEALIESGPVSG